jgi:hypothetical protein
LRVVCVVIVVLLGLCVAFAEILQPMTRSLPFPP